MLIELFIVLAAGFAFGSFVTCASYRLPLELDVVRKPSYCPSCNTILKYRDLCPLFSWLSSGGKCRYCAAKISIRYPLIELATGAAFALLYSLYGLTYMSFILAAMAVALLIMIVVDLEHFIIPDCVHIILLILAFAYRFVTGTLSYDILYGFALMTGVALFLHYGYSRLRGRTMLGYGDVKFFSVAGVWLDLSAIPVFLFISGMLGVVFGLAWRMLGKGPVFPFGPALALALFICVTYPEINNILFSIN